MNATLKPSAPSASDFKVADLGLARLIHFVALAYLIATATVFGRFVAPVVREALVKSGKAAIGKVLRELGAGGATILLAEQNMHFCLRIAEEALVIDKGKVHRQDTAGLAANEDIRRRYLAM